MLPGSPKSTVTATELPEKPELVKATVCVVPATPLLSSVMVSVPLSVPTAVGVKVTLRVQLAPTLKLPSQLSVSEKAPLAEMLVMVSGCVPKD